MTKQEIYEKIVRLTAELTVINIASKIFEAAKTGEPEEVETVFETFKKENSKLHQEIIDFGEKYNEINDCLDKEIFAELRNCNGYWVFDPTKINAANFYLLTLIVGSDDSEFFRWTDGSADKYIEAIKEEGYEELSKFANSDIWTDWVGENKEYLDIYRFLVGIFRGDFQ